MTRWIITLALSNRCPTPQSQRFADTQAEADTHQKQRPKWFFHLLHEQLELFSSKTSGLSCLIGGIPFWVLWEVAVFEGNGLFSFCQAVPPLARQKLSKVVLASFRFFGSDASTALRHRRPEVAHRVAQPQQRVRHPLKWLVASQSQ